MQEYLRSLLLVASVAVLAGLLLPENNERMKRLLEFGIALLVLTVICRPLANIGDLSAVLSGIRFPSGSETAGELDADTRTAMERAVGDGIESDLAARYGIPATCFSAKVQLSLGREELTISSLTLSVSGEGKLLDLRAVCDYAARAYQTNCEVIPDGG